MSRLIFLIILHYINILNANYSNYIGIDLGTTFSSVAIYNMDTN